MKMCPVGRANALTSASLTVKDDKLLLNNAFEFLRMITKKDSPCLFEYLWNVLIGFWERFVDDFP